jgi:predicted phosphoribosyltransferase
MFRDRADAGRQLADALHAYAGEDQDVVVLAIPRGGVEVGYHVARRLDADFSLLVTRKLPFPHNPESGFGAIAEDGSTFIYEHAAEPLPPETIERVIEFQKQEIQRRVEVLREGRPLPTLSGRTVILVDDGIAMGSTMRASIQLCRNREAGKIVVAVPVAGARGKAQMRRLADDVVVLETPPFFRAVAQVYERWYDVSDQEVLSIVARWRREQEAA